MEKNLFGKILVLGIIVLFIGVGIQPAFAEESISTISSKNKSVKKENISKDKLKNNREIQPANQDNGKPDLEVVGIGYHYIGHACLFDLYVLNVGDAPLPAWRYKRTRLIVKPRYGQKIVFEDTHWCAGEFTPHNPGETDNFYHAEVPSLFPGVYRCYFEVAYDRQWDEWDYTNWAKNLNDGIIDKDPRNNTQPNNSGSNNQRIMGFGEMNQPVPTWGDYMDDTGVYGTTQRPGSSHGFIIEYEKRP